MYAGEPSSVGCTPYDGLYREAPCVRDIFFIHQVYESLGKVLVHEVFGMVFGAGADAIEILCCMVGSFIL